MKNTFVEDSCAQAEPELNRAGTFQANTSCCCAKRVHCIFGDLFKFISLFISLLCGELFVEA